jgi:hypothetical protein
MTEIAIQTKTPVPDTTTLVPPATAKGVKVPKAKAAKAPAAPMPTPTTKTKAPITRHVPAGARVDPDATTVTCNIDIRDVKTHGNKNWTRAAAGYPKAGESKLLAACIKDGVTKGDVLYDWCRGWLELDPPPAVPTK